MRWSVTVKLDRKWNAKESAPFCAHSGNLRHWLRFSASTWKCNSSNELKYNYLSDLHLKTEGLGICEDVSISEESKFGFIIQVKCLIL